MSTGAVLAMLSLAKKMTNVRSDAVHLAAKLRRAVHMKLPERDFDLECLTVAHKFLYDDRVELSVALPSDLFGREMQMLNAINFCLHHTTRYDRVVAHLEENRTTVHDAMLCNVLLYSEVIHDDDDLAVCMCIRDIYSQLKLPAPITWVRNTRISTRKIPTSNIQKTDRNDKRISWMRVMLRRSSGGGE